MRRYTQRMKRNTNTSASAIARCKFPFAPVPLLQTLTKLTARYVLALTHGVSESNLYRETALHLEAEKPAKKLEKLGPSRRP